MQTHNNNFGKLPPQAIDLEEAVLGAVMLENAAMLHIVDIITPDCFYKDAHQRIYKQILKLYSENKPIDILTVTQSLRKSKELEQVGGAYYITKLTSRIASAANIEYHARIILQKFIQRELIRVSGQTIQQAFEDTTDVFDLTDSSAANIGICQERLIGKKMDHDITSQVRKTWNHISSPDSVAQTGITTGFKELDEITGGWQRKEMTVLMARPGMGKTTWIIQSVLAAAAQGKRVAVFSIEMGVDQLLMRSFSHLSGVSHDLIKKRRLDQHQMDQVQEAAVKVQSLPLYICDEPRINTQMLRTAIRTQNRNNKQPIDMIVIDYMQMLSIPDGLKFSNRDAEMTAISRDLKAIAKEFDVPLIVISSMNRDCEKRMDKRPEQSDARDSGSIESDADLILGLYRPAVYWEEPGQSKEDFFRQMDETTYKQITELIILKHRSGNIATLLQLFDGPHYTFNPYQRSKSYENSLPYAEKEPF